MHYPHHFPSMIMWLCCIAKEYHAPTSYLLTDAILLIATTTIQLATCVYHVRYISLQFKECFSTLQSDSIMNSGPTNTS